MTFDAWRSAVGGQWQRLLIYPGGLTAIALAALGWGLWALLAGARPARAGGLDETLWSWLALAGPCAALALMPLPKADELRSPLDLPTAWLLLDLPLLAVVAPALSAPGGSNRRDFVARAARLAGGALVAVPLLALVLAAWGAATRGWTVASLGGDSLGGGVPRWFRWACCAVWLIALVPALGLGPWHEPAGLSRAVVAGLGLRRLGHALLLTLALLPLWPQPASDAQDWLTLARRDGRLQALLTLGAVWLTLLAFQRVGRGHSPVIWGRAAWGGGLIALAGLVWLGFQGWPG